MDPNFFSSSTQEELLSQSDLHLWDLPIDPFFDILAAISDPLQPSPPPCRQSAFSKYSGTPPWTVQEPENSRQSIHHRLIELLRWIEGSKQAANYHRGGGGGGEGSRGFRHMMRERQRRERLSQSYADMHSMLPPRAKADKNSIVQEAAALVRELKRMKQGMQNRAQELRNRAGEVATANGLGVRGVKEEEIEFYARNPDSAIDCLISALRCLDQMNIKATSLRTQDFSACSGGGGFTAVVTIETLKEGEAMEAKEMMRRLAT